MKVSIGPYDNNLGQVKQVHIDEHDTYSMDHTLALIILPMLKQLKENNQGAPNVDSSDVPEELRMNDINAKEYWNDGTTDEKFFERWDWVLDEMIWAFEQKCRDDWMQDYFGPWIEHTDSESSDGIYHLGEFEWKDMEGLNAHQARMSNGFRLFGVYYESLWT